MKIVLFSFFRNEPSCRVRRRVSKPRGFVRPHLIPLPSPCPPISIFSNIRRTTHRLRLRRQRSGVQVGSEIRPRPLQPTADVQPKGSERRLPLSGCHRSAAPSSARFLPPDLVNTSFLQPPSRDLKITALPHAKLAVRRADGEET